MDPGVLTEPTKTLHCPLHIANSYLLSSGQFMASVSIVKPFPEVFLKTLETTVLEKAEPSEMASTEDIFHSNGPEVLTGTSFSR